MIEKKITAIGAYQYRVTQLGSTQGRRLLVVLTGLLGPALAELFRSGQLLNADSSVVSDAVVKLVGQLDPDTVEREVLALLESTTEFTSPTAAGVWLPIAGDPGHWSGRFLDMFKWLKFALEVNYNDFFAVLPSVKVGSQPTVDGK